MEEYFVKKQRITLAVALVICLSLTGLVFVNRMQATESSKTTDIKETAQTTKPSSTGKPNETAKTSPTTKPSQTTKPSPTTKPSQTTKTSSTTKPSSTNSTDTTDNKGEKKRAKYVFLFIGDGMGLAQVQAAQIYKGDRQKMEIKPMDFFEFPTIGLVETADSTSFCPDSASTATAISSGVKTKSGVIGKTPDLAQEVRTITEDLHEAGVKVGIISTVTLNHATPAAFYANVDSRKEYYDIAKQMADSEFDYFAGGSLHQRTGKNKDQEDVYEYVKSKGYKITETKADFDKLTPKDGKVFAVTERQQDEESMPYTMDQKPGDMTLADVVRKGIEMLDNEKGFFMMAEGGKVDWACHANDAAAAIHEVLGLNDAVKEAVKFYQKHPDETLILVTADHETGGLALGYQGTGYDTHFELLEKQKASYVEFDKIWTELKEEKKDELKWEDASALVQDFFGLVIDEKVKEGDELKDIHQVNRYELDMLKAAFKEDQKPEEEQGQTYQSSLSYGGYTPFTTALTHLIDNKAGIGWTSFGHTAIPVPIYALGVGAEDFAGSFHDSQIYNKMKDKMDVEELQKKIK